MPGHLNAGLLHFHHPALHRVLCELGRAHGVRGEVRLKSFTADPRAIAGYGPFTTDAGSTLAIAGVRPAPGGPADILIAQVEGVADRNAAEALRGVRLHVPRSRLPQIEAVDEFYRADLVGLRVEDPNGRVVGTVTAVQDFGAGDLLEIKPQDGGDSLLVEIARLRVIRGSTPNRALLTSQVVEVIKLKPYFCMAGAALPPTSRTIYSTRTMVRPANTSVKLRNTRSTNTSKVDGGLEIESPVAISRTDPNAASRSVAGNAMGSRLYWMLSSALLTTWTTLSGRGM